MIDKPSASKTILLPLAVVAVLIIVWTAVWKAGIFHESAFPSPLAVLRGFGEEIRSGRLFNDLITSLFRVSCGFVIAVATGVPMGLWMGQRLAARLAFLPIINFFRNLSPLAVDVMDKLIKGEAVDGMANFTLAELTVDDSKTGEVPCVFLEVQQVNKDNVYDLVVKSGFQSYDDVYRDIPDADKPPKP